MTEINERDVRHSAGHRGIGVMGYDELSVSVLCHYGNLCFNISVPITAKSITNVLVFIYFLTRIIIGFE